MHLSDAEALRRATAWTERDLLAHVRELARGYGWLTFHHQRSDRSEPGFPDLVLIRERVVWVELKTDRGRLSPHQQHVLELLAATGAEVYVWRPADLNEIVRILSQGGAHADQNG